MYEVIEDVPLFLAPPLLPAHDIGVSSTRTRRRFTVAYKLKILEAAAQCTKSGDLGALLRREGLYTSHLAASRAPSAWNSSSSFKKTYLAHERHLLDLKLQQTTVGARSGVAVYLLVAFVPRKKTWSGGWRADLRVVTPILQHIGQAAGRSSRYS